MSIASLQGVLKVKTALDSLDKNANLFRERHPDVKGLSRFCNRVKKGASAFANHQGSFTLVDSPSTFAFINCISKLLRQTYSIRHLAYFQFHGYKLHQSASDAELFFAEHLEEQLQEATEPTEGTGSYKTKLTNKVQGLKNNFRGLAAELQVAQTVPGVVGLSQAFRLNKRGDDKAHPDWPKTIEVDVVAQGGHLWIEVKDSEWFGIGSTRWVGTGGRSAGIKAQAMYQAHAAKQPVNSWRWQPPRVMYYFPSGIDSSIREELSDMGILVSTGNAISLDELPTPPPAPSATNLDVTALCALCSEVCNDDPDSAEIQAWAAHKPYLKDCVATEKVDPLMPQLMHYLHHNRPIYAAEGAVLQFELLLAQFGGPKERRRWRGWKESIMVVNGSTQVDKSARIEALACSSSMTEAQKRIFDVGDSKQAVTITANGHALQSAAAQGVQIEAFVHKAMWLTGV